MKLVTGLCFGLLMVGVCSTAPANAQETPRGSYLSSCSGARVEGDTLVAHCRAVDGSESRSALADVNRCVGDIGNDNGVLRCNYGPRGGSAAQPMPPGVVRAADRCGDLRHEAHELRERMDHTGDPIERGRLEARFHEVDAEADRCR